MKIYFFNFIFVISLIGCGFRIVLARLEKPFISSIEEVDENTLKVTWQASSKSKNLTRFRIFYTNTNDERELFEWPAQIRKLDKNVLAEHYYSDHFNSTFDCYSHCSKNPTCTIAIFSPSSNENIPNCFMKSKITKEDIEFTNGEEIIGFVKVTNYKNEAFIRGIPTNYNYSFTVMVYDEYLDEWSHESDTFYYIGKPIEIELKYKVDDQNNVILYWNKTRGSEKYTISRFNIRMSDNDASGNEVNAQTIPVLEDILKYKFEPDYYKLAKNGSLTSNNEQDCFIKCLSKPNCIRYVFFNTTNNCHLLTSLDLTKSELRHKNSVAYSIKSSSTQHKLNNLKPDVIHNVQLEYLNVFGLVHHSNTLKLKKNSENDKVELVNDTLLQADPNTNTVTTNKPGSSSQLTSVKITSTATTKQSRTTNNQNNPNKDDKNPNQNINTNNSESNPRPGNDTKPEDQVEKTENEDSIYITIISNNTDIDTDNDADTELDENTFTIPNNLKNTTVQLTNQNVIVTPSGEQTDQNVEEIFYSTSTKNANVVVNGNKDPQQGNSNDGDHTNFNDNQTKEPNFNDNQTKEPNFNDKQTKEPNFDDNQTKEPKFNASQIIGDRPNKPPGEYELGNQTVIIDVKPVQVKKANENFEAECSINGGSGKHPTWVKVSDRSRNTAKRYEQEYLHNPPRTKLIIRKLSRDDQGIYECVLFNGSSSSPSNRVELTVTDVPSKPTILNATMVDDHIYIKWSVNDNGGMDLSKGVLELSPDNFTNKSNIQRVELEKEQLTNGEIRINRTQLPNNSTSFRFYVENDLGPSEKTDIFTANCFNSTCLKLYYPDQIIEKVCWMRIIIIIFGLLVLLIIICLIVYTICTAKKSNTTREVENTQPLLGRIIV